MNNNSDNNTESNNPFANYRELAERFQNNSKKIKTLQAEQVQLRITLKTVREQLRELDAAIRTPRKKVVDEEDMATMDDDTSIGTPTTGIRIGEK